MQKRSAKQWLTLAAVLAVPGIALSQSGDSKHTLSIAGQTGQAPLVKIQGKTYIELEALARLTHGSLTFEGTQTTLTLPDTTTAAAPPASNSDFSKPFLRAGIEEMSVIREWRIALTNAVQRGIPVTDDFMALYRGPAQTDLRLASVAAETDSDHNAYQLLSNEYENMRKLSDRLVAQHDSQTYTSPDVLQNDPLALQILNCARSLANMAAANQYTDDGSCH
jgi:hypothetical protein